MPRAVRVLVALLLMAFAVIELGAVLEAHGANAGFGCERVIDNEGSTFQDGGSTPRLWPPAVRCTYAATTFDGHEVPAASVDSFPWIGSFFVGSGLIAVAVLVGAITVSFRRARRARAATT